MNLRLDIVQFVKLRKINRLIFDISICFFFFLFIFLIPAQTVSNDTHPLIENARICMPVYVVDIIVFGARKL